MACAYVNSSSVYTGAMGDIVLNSITSGNMIFCIITGAQGTAAVITKAGSTATMGSWLQIAQYQPTTEVEINIFAAPCTGSGNLTVTVSGTLDDPEFVLLEASGCATSSYQDGSAVGAMVGSSAQITFDTGDIATDTADELHIGVWACERSDETLTPAGSPSWTLRQNQDTHWMQVFTRVVSATGNWSFDGAITSATYFAVAMVAIRGVTGIPLEIYDPNWASCGGSYVVTNYEVYNNQYRNESDWQFAGARYSTSAVDNSQIIVKAHAKAKFAAVRMSATGTGYGIALYDISGDHFQYTIFTKNGAYLNLRAGSWLTANDHTLRIAASGTSTVTLSSWVDGVQQTDVIDADATIAAGNPGFYNDEVQSGIQANSYFADWTDGARGGPSTTPKGLRWVIF